MTPHYFHSLKGGFNQLHDTPLLPLALKGGFIQLHGTPLLPLALKVGFYSTL